MFSQCQLFHAPSNPTGMDFGYECILIPSKMVFLFHVLPIVLRCNFKKEGGGIFHTSLSSGLTFSKKKKIYRKFQSFLRHFDSTKKKKSSIENIGKGSFIQSWLIHFVSSIERKFLFFLICFVNTR